MKFTIEAVLRSAADPIKDEKTKDTPHTKSSYPAMPNSMAYTSPCLLL